MVEKSNRQAICDVLLEAAKKDRNLIVVCSDSRGSASLTAFADTFPNQFVDCGIAEQNLVSIAAGLARCGKKVYAFSPACFLTTRSLEQCKVDVAYSNTNVKLIGISGGISYGALGSTHHSTQDIAIMSSLPNMRVYLPSDSIQTMALIGSLLNDDKPAYVRVGRNPVECIYEDELSSMRQDHATVIGKGSDLLIVACGESVLYAKKAVEKLVSQNIMTTLLDMYCVKPIDRETILFHAKTAKAILTVEEHVRYGGLGSQVAQLLAESTPRHMSCLTLPDESVIAGSTGEVFAHYGIDTEGIVYSARRLLERV